MKFRVSQVCALIVIAIIASSFTLLKKGELPRALKKIKVVTHIPGGQLNSVETGDMFMFKAEVTNLQYREFLHALKSGGNIEALEVAQIHQENWSNIDCESLTINCNLYHKIDEYPVVNISRRGAELYCEWLTNHWNSKQSKYVVEFRLPTAIEWEFAARSGRYDSPYPWGGYYIKNNKACYLAQVKDKNHDHAYGPIEVLSYFPNDFGLYNMSGNVAEMVSEKDVALGGHWDSPPSEATIQSNIPLEVSPFIGFRPVMKFTKK